MFKILGWCADDQQWELISVSRKEVMARDLYHELKDSRAWEYVALVLSTNAGLRMVLSDFPRNPASLLTIPAFAAAARRVFVGGE
jgi:hypothetical protein